MKNVQIIRIIIQIIQIMEILQIIPILNYSNIIHIIHIANNSNYGNYGNKHIRIYCLLGIRKEGRNETSIEERESVFEENKECKKHTIYY